MYAKHILRIFVWFFSWVCVYMFNIFFYNLVGPILNHPRMKLGFEFNYPK